MVAATDPFAAWLDQAQLRDARLSPEQHHLLQAVWRFRQRQGDDYYSTRLLSHILLHCESGLPVAAIARLLRLSRPTASRHQRLCSRQAIQQAHHRLDGKNHGKLLPRYAGPIAGFLHRHPKATRAQVLTFIDQTFGVRVSRIALYKFLKKYGLDAVSASGTGSSPDVQSSVPAPAADSASQDSPPLVPEPLVPPRPVDRVPATLPGPTPAPPFSTHAPSTPVPS